jgi:predicted kinase
MTALATHELGLGHAVVLDSVAKTESIRTTWREVALRCDAKIVIVECVLTDEAMHRARMDGRLRKIPGWPELTWDEVEQVRATFAPWRDERLVLDAVLPLAENLKALDDRLARA